MSSDTLTRLCRGLTLDALFLTEVAPRFDGQEADRQRVIIGAVGGAFGETLREYNIATPLRLVHFTAQVTHECAHFRTTEEFASGEAYEGRADLGNTEPGDGTRYKGRGLIQLTGRANYRQIGERLGLPLEDTPRLAAEPVTSLRIACEYWLSRDINVVADQDDLIGVTRLINGGTNGLADRARCLERARLALAVRLAARLKAAQDGGPVLSRGSFGAEVVDLQFALVRSGLPLCVDGTFGAATETALRIFQMQRSLSADGLAGRVTRLALGL